MMIDESQCPHNFHIENTYHWPSDGESRPWTEFWVTTFTRSVGEATAVAILYSVNRGQSWQQAPMEKSCVLGDRDVWHVGLGHFPAHTQIRYAVEAINSEGQSILDNCHGKDHYAVIGSAKDLSVMR